MTDPAPRPLAPAAFAAKVAEGLTRLKGLAHHPQAAQSMQAFAETLDRLAADAQDLARHLARSEAVEGLTLAARAAVQQQHLADEEELLRQLGAAADAELAGPHGPALAAKQMVQRDPLTWRCLTEEVARLGRLAAQPVPPDASRRERFHAFQFGAAVARVRQWHHLMAALLAAATQAQHQHDKRAEAAPDCVASMVSAEALAAFLHGFADLRARGLHEPPARLAAMLHDAHRGLPVRLAGQPLPLGGRPGLTINEANRRGCLAIALDALALAHPQRPLHVLAQQVAERVNLAPHRRVTWQQVKKWRKDCMGEKAALHPETRARWRFWQTVRAARTQHAPQEWQRVAEAYLAALTAPAADGFEAGARGQTSPCFRPSARPHG